MQVTVEKDQILEGLLKAAALGGARPGNILGNVLYLWLQARPGSLEIMFTNIDAEFSSKTEADVRQEGLVGVPVKRFVDLVKLVPAGAVSMRLSDNGSCLYVTSGRNRYDLPVTDAAFKRDFAEVPESGAVLVSGDMLHDLFDHVFFCIDKEEGFAMNCLALQHAGDEQIDCVGISGTRMTHVRFADPELSALIRDGSLLIRRKNLIQLRKWLRSGDYLVSMTTKRVFFRSSAGNETLSLPRDEQAFPDYGRILNSVTNSRLGEMTFAREEVADALTRLSTFGETPMRCTRFNFSENEARLSANDQTGSAGTESVDVKYEGSLTEIVFPTSFLLEIIDHFTSGELALHISDFDLCSITGPDDPGYTAVFTAAKDQEAEYEDDPEAGADNAEDGACDGAFDYHGPSRDMPGDGSEFVVR
jgi:DNA polymerase-3 subunit beta